MYGETMTKEMFDDEYSKIKLKERWECIKKKREWEGESEKKAFGVPKDSKSLIEKKLKSHTKKEQKA